jgi:hypothetical protein
MPKWKAQTPIEVFEDNDVSVDARSGAERLGNKHRYHVGDSSRRKSIDKAGFRDDTAIDSTLSGSKRAQGKTFPAFGGSVPVPSPLGLASAPGSPEKFFPGGAKEFGAALMRQSSADERDLARDLLGPPPPPSSPFAARREPSANHRPGNLSPPRSPTRARAFSHVDDDVPSRPSSPAFGSSGAGAGAREENPDSVRTWGASDARRMGVGGAAWPAPPRSVPAKAPATLQRSQSMGSFADDVLDLQEVERGAPLAAAKENGGAAGKKTSAKARRPPPPRSTASSAADGGGGEARPAVWDVFGGDRNGGAKK